METHTVILYGKSMLVSLIAASISPSQRLRVLSAESWEEVMTLAETYPLDVLVFDLPSASEGHLLTLLSRQPRLQLIGLDVETNRAILLTSQATDNLTLERVKEIVQQ
jgi:MinD-like ATPase involved in chromosome partitioning or flagellar assembly